MNIAVAHPGKIGDLLFALPVVKFLSEHHGCLVDVYTSPYCRVALDVIGCQPYVRRAMVLEEYVMEHFLLGAQPWYMPVPDHTYDAVYQLGFRDFPDRHCIGFVAHQVGLPEPDPDAFHLHIPDTGCVARKQLKAPYVVMTTMSSTGGGSMTWPWSNRKVSDFVEACPYPVYVVGREEEWNRYACAGSFEPLPDLTFLEIAEVMKGARAVVTYSTGLGVLASGVLNGSDTPLVCMFDGEVSWDVFRLPGAITCSPDEDLRRIAFRERNLKDLEECTARLERTNREHARLLEIRTQDLQSRRDESERLVRECGELHEQLHAQNLEIEKLRNGFAEAHHLIHARNLELETVRQSDVEAHHLLHTRNLEIEQLRTQVGEAQQSVTARQRDVDALQQVVEACRLEHQLLTADHERLTRERNAAHENLVQIQATWSWRSTAPLRRLFRRGTR